MVSKFGNKITVDDVYDLAEEFGLEWADVMMIIDVESRGTGFYKGTIEPVVLFEGKYFHRLTGGIYDEKYPEISFPINNRSTRKYYNLDQVQQIQKAYRLNKAAALMSASWGMMQVMGANYKMVGYDTIFEMVKAMYESEVNQIRVGLMYIKNAGLIPKIKTGDYDGIRRGYNGNTDVDTYDYTGKLQRSHIRFKAIQQQRSLTTTLLQ